MDGLNWNGILTEKRKNGFNWLRHDSRIATIFLPIARNSFAIIYRMVYHVEKLGEKINRIEQNKLALNRSKKSAKSGRNKGGLMFDLAPRWCSATAWPNWTTRPEQGDLKLKKMSDKQNKIGHFIPLNTVLLVNWDEFMTREVMRGQQRSFLTEQFLVMWKFSRSNSF